MSAPQLPPSSVIAGKYAIGSCMGYGGSSATYHAATQDGREVALKLFDPAIRQRADVMAALEQTYAATNALPQDVAVPLLDAGYDPQTGAPFSVTERIKFPSLSQLTVQRPLTPEEVANVLAMMGRVLDYAHARQLNHHALKPTNVFVGFSMGGGVRVTDFGAGLVRNAVPTQEGYALTAPWLAPEQAQGGMPVGPAADVFAAALVAFFALTGRSYWRSCQGALDVQGWQREIMSPRTPPSARALQLGVTLNSSFDSVLNNALSLDPSQRYRSVGEFANAVEALVGSRVPESQATMAFPAMALLGGDYPPPPQPTGGMAPPPPAAGQPAQQQQPYQQQQQPMQQQPAQAYQQQQQQPMQQQPMGQRQPGDGLGETSAGRPIEPGLVRKPKSTARIMTAVVAVVVLVAVAGGVAAVVLMGKKGGEGASGSGSAAPADSASAPVAAADSAPAASGAPVDSAAAAGSAEVDAGPPGQEVSLVCDPECDEIKVDDQPLDLAKKPYMLQPGKHTIIASKADFKPVNETITVVMGKKLEKKFKLKPTAPAAPTGTPAAGPAPGPAPGPGPGPGKQCGKFLKRCGK